MKKLNGLFFHEHPKIIVFDGICNFCSFWIQCIHQIDKSRQFEFTSVQSETGQQLLKWADMDEHMMDSFIYIENGQVYTMSDAIIRISHSLPLPWRLTRLWKFTPRRLRNLGYKFLSRNRYRIAGQKNHCNIPPDELRSRFI